MTTEDKMYFIAKQYNYLNALGKVKAIKGNEKGYAKIKEIVRGCALFVHHMNNDQLIINLLVSPTAKTRYELTCKNSVDIFQIHFKTDSKSTKWENSMGDGKIYDRYIVDVTRDDMPELLVKIEAVKTELAGANLKGIAT